MATTTATQEEEEEPLKLEEQYTISEEENI